MTDKKPSKPPVTPTPSNGTVVRRGQDSGKNKNICRNRKKEVMPNYGLKQPACVV